MGYLSFDPSSLILRTSKHVHSELRHSHRVVEQVSQWSRLRDSRTRDSFKHTTSVAMAAKRKRGERFRTSASKYHIYKYQTFSFSCMKVCRLMTSEVWLLIPPSKIPSSNWPVITLWVLMKGWALIPRHSALMAAAAEHGAAWRGTTPPELAQVQVLPQVLCIPNVCLCRSFFIMCVCVSWSLTMQHCLSQALCFNLLLSV